MTLHLLNDIVDDVESTRKLRHYSLKGEQTCNLINIIQCLGLLRSSLPGWALRMHVESLSRASRFNTRSQSLAW